MTTITKSKSVSQKQSEGNLLRSFQFQSLEDGRAIRFQANLTWTRCEGKGGKKNWTGTLSEIESGKSTFFKKDNVSEDNLSHFLLPYAKKLANITNEQPLVRIAFKRESGTSWMSAKNGFYLQKQSHENNDFKVYFKGNFVFNQNKFKFSTDHYGQIDLLITSYQAKVIKKNATEEWEVSLADDVIDRWERRFDFAWTAFFG